MKIVNNRSVKILLLVVIGVFLCFINQSAFAQSAGAALNSNDGGTLLPMGIRVQFDTANSPQEISKSVQIFLLMTVLSLAPSIVITTTSFVRILIVFSFLKQALGTQQAPPSQVLTGLAIFLTIFIMSPVWMKIHNEALKPYMDGVITQAQAWEKGVEPLKQFMLKQTGNNELALFLELAKKGMPQHKEDIGLEILIPSFMTSELKTAFQMGFLIYLPFLVIDMVVSTSLMALGMMMLPPMMISLPIKVLFFVLADGWTLVVRNIVRSFSV
jgi:flagellar biosynthetic protein FliP